MDNFKYFSLSEFACPCCRQNNISLKLVSKLDQARSIAGIPFHINSGFRCVKHNAKVEGRENSSHLRGYASDIRVDDNASRFKILSALIQCGFNRIGVYKTFIHADIDPTLPKNVIWNI